MRDSHGCARYNRQLQVMMMLKSFFCIALLVVCNGLAWGTALPIGQITQPAQTLWNASGSSATQGLGSITTANTGTASCSAPVQVTQTQINTTNVPGQATWALPGSGVFIKVVCTGGGSGGTVRHNINTPAVTLGHVLVGQFMYFEAGYNANNNVLNQYLADTSGFANRIRFDVWPNSSYSRRKEGWNLVQSRCTPTLAAPDYVLEAGAFACATTSVSFVQIEVGLNSNASVTLYFGDIFYKYAARPKVYIFAADNDKGVMTTMLPYMSARNIKGGYAPTTDELTGGSNITVADLLTLQAAGWTIHAHQSNSSGLNYTSMSVTDLRNEILHNAQVLTALGLQLSKIYYYPGGNRNENTDAILQEFGFTHNPNSNPSADMNGRPYYGGLIGGFLTVGASELSAVNTIAVIKHAISYSEHVGILWHTMPTAGCDITCFQTVINELVRLRDANIIDVVTPDEVISQSYNPRKKR
jgi:peptidoglycan/xylan/chitin deacetylase (PgdA/CDA1 family)